MVHKDGTELLEIKETCIYIYIYIYIFADGLAPSGIHVHNGPTFEHLITRLVKYTILNLVSCLYLLCC